MKRVVPKNFAENDSFAIMRKVPQIFWKDERKKIHPHNHLIDKKDLS